jgi:AraC-like DNA-binding protein
MNMKFTEKLRVNSCGKVYCKPDWLWDNWSNAKMPDLDLWVIVSGKGTLKTKEKTYALSMGDCFILNDRKAFLGTTDRDFPLVVIYIHFELCDESGKVIRSVYPEFYRKMDNFPFFVQLLERVLILKAARRGPEAAGWLKAALLEINAQDEQLKTVVDSSMLLTHINTLCTAIREHPEQRFSLKAEAKKVFYSGDHFARLFKQQTGTSFRNYILRSRMETAAFYLLSTSYSIGRIAEILGYNDIYLFSRQFKKITGQSPGLYRKQIKK